MFYLYSSVSVHIPKWRCSASPWKQADAALQRHASDSSGSSPPRTRGSSSESYSNRNCQYSIVHYQFVALLYGVHAKSNHSQRYTSCTSASQYLTFLAVVDGLAGSGTRAPIARDAPPFPALCPRRGWPTSWCNSDMVKAYPLIKFERCSNVVSRKVSLIIPAVFILMKSFARLRL